MRINGDDPAAPQGISGPARPEEERSMAPRLARWLVTAALLVASAPGLSRAAVPRACGANFEGTIPDTGMLLGPTCEIRIDGNPFRVAGAAVSVQPLQSARLQPVVWVALSPTASIFDRRLECSGMTVCFQKRSLANLVLGKTISCVVAVLGVPGQRVTGVFRCSNSLSL
jgi:hypothetical protein